MERNKRIRAPVETMDSTGGTTDVVIDANHGMDGKQNCLSESAERCVGGSIDLHALKQKPINVLQEALSDPNLGPAAFEELLENKYRTILEKMYRGRGLKWDEIEDLIQEVNLKVWRNWKAYDRTRPFEPWLRSIARNTLNDSKRRRRDLPVAVGYDPNEVAAKSNACRAESKEQNARIEAAINALPEPNRTAVRMRKLSHTVREIADVLSIKTSRVYPLLAKGCELIREALGIRHDTS